jgi:hypothetical protein
MKKVCATMVLKDLSDEQEKRGKKSAQTFQQDCRKDTAFKKCCITNALTGTEDDMLWNNSDLD